MLLVETDIYPREDQLIFRSRAKYKIEKLLINRQAFFVLQAVLGKVFIFFAFHKAKKARQWVILTIK
jgi:hypothetical protein